MDRRNLLALATVLPALVPSPAFACSVALKSSRSAGLENDQVRKLFNAWWLRDKSRFQRLFTETLMSDGSPMEPKLAAELTDQNPIPTGTFDVFDRFFTDESKINRITLILNSHAGVIVACSEESPAADIQPDCTGMPALHLFLIAMSGLNPRTITHLATTRTVETSKFSIWTE